MQKFIFLFLISLAFYSCGPTLIELQSIYGSKDFYSIDFTKYSKLGFLITPEKYIGEYESIGIVRYEVYPGATYQLISNKPNPKYGTNANEPMMITVRAWDIKKISMQEVIDGMYDQCRQMGADALINFDVKYESIPYSGISNPVTINGYTISGFAIKRK